MTPLPEGVTDGQEMNMGSADAAPNVPVEEVDAGSPRGGDEKPLVMGPGSGGQLRAAQEWALTLRGSMVDAERKGKRFVVNDDPKADEPTAYIADTVTGNVVSDPYKQSVHGSGFREMAGAEADRRNTLEADPNYNPFAATREQTAEGHDHDSSREADRRSPLNQNTNFSTPRGE